MVCSRKNNKEIYKYFFLKSVKGRRVPVPEVDRNSGIPEIPGLFVFLTRNGCVIKVRKLGWVEAVTKF